MAWFVPRTMGWKAVSAVALVTVWGCSGGVPGGGGNADTTHSNDLGLTDDGAAGDDGSAGEDGASGGASSGGASSGGAGDAAGGASDGSGGGASGGGASGGGTSGGGDAGGGASGGGSGDAAGGSSSGGAADAGSSGGGSSGGGDAAGSSSGGGADGSGGGPKACTYDASKGPDGSECPQGQSCLVGVGKCAGLVVGQCAPTPNVCPAVVAPVCGCDGKTYSSLCDAQVAGAIVKAGGACAKPPVACGGAKGATCAGGEICDKGCGIDGAGTCQPAPPKTCPNGGSEQCGCDGKTYPSACFRQQAGVGLAHDGACPTGPTSTTCKLGPVKPVLCPSGYYCKLNTLGMCSGYGKCTPTPPVCDKSNKPVCGCDKNTYANACKLAQAGFSPLSLDPCK